jgi:hypothetical protein
MDTAKVYFIQVPSASHDVTVVIMPRPSGRRLVELRDRTQRGIRGRAYSKPPVPSKDEKN